MWQAEGLDLHTEKIGDACISITSLSIGSTTLQVLDSEIVSIESTQNVDCNNRLKNSIGWMEYENEKIPVYCMNDKLEIDINANNNTAVHVVMKHGEARFSLECSQAMAFTGEIVKISGLPECMQAARSPIDSLCLYRDTNKNCVNYIVSAESIARYIESI